MCKDKVVGSSPTCGAYKIRAPLAGAFNFVDSAGCVENLSPNCPEFDEGAMPSGNSSNPTCGAQ